MTFEWRAEAKVERAGRTLPAVASGHISAADRAAAEAQARLDAEKVIAVDYNDYRIVPGWLRIRVSRNDPPGSDTAVTVRVLLRCNTMIVQDKPVLTILGLPVINDTETTDTFEAQLTVKDEGEEKPYRGRIKTTGRGNATESHLSFLVWQGELPAGDTRDLRLSMHSEGGGHPSDVGVFTVRLRDIGGRLQVDWVPEQSTRVLGPSRGGPTFTTRLRLDGGGMVYDVNLIASRATEVRQAAREAARKFEAENKAFGEKLRSGGDAVRAMQGSVHAAAVEGGRRTEVGVGRIFVVGRDPAAGRAFRDRVFPGYSQVDIVRDETETLDRLFREARTTTFRNAQIDEASVRVTLTDKKGLTVLDHLQKMNRQGPGPRQPRR